MAHFVYTKEFDETYLKILENEYDVNITLYDIDCEITWSSMNNRFINPNKYLSQEHVCLTTDGKSFKSIILPIKYNKNIIAYIGTSISTETL